MAAKAKVQCAGHIVTDPTEHRIEQCWICIHNGCGWTGRRKNDREYYGPDSMEPAATIDPCPRCGGKVALIGQDQETSDA